MLVGTPRIFLCYAREDETPVSRVYDKLKLIGFRPWMDKRDLRVGDSWENKISKAINQSHFFLIFLSKGSVERQSYQQKEYEFAMQVVKTMPTGSIFIVPVRLEECLIPAGVAELQTCDLFEDTGFERLLQVVRSQKLGVLIVRALQRSCRVGVLISAATLISAFLIARLHDVAGIREREVLAGLFDAAGGLLFFWVVGIQLLKGTHKGTAVGLMGGLLAGAALTYGFDPYPVSDVVRQFTMQNPNGAWSYGFETQLGSNLSLFGDGDREIDEGAEGFARQYVGYAHIPLILHNPTHRTIERLGFIHLSPNLIEMHPGWHGEFCIVRWTANDAGLYQIRGYFVGINPAPTTTDVHVISNSKSHLFDAEVDSFGVPATFSAFRKLSPGEAVDFAVGSGSNKEPTSDSTGLAASIRRQP